MKPTIGRTVHFVENGAHRPAIIIDLNLADTVDLVIFKDPDMYPDNGLPLYHRYAVKFDEVTKYSNTCHWPEREE